MPVDLGPGSGPGRCVVCRHNTVGDEARRDMDSRALRRKSKQRRDIEPVTSAFFRWSASLHAGQRTLAHGALDERLGHWERGATSVPTRFLSRPAAPGKHLVAHEGPCCAN